jgi:hypothetical protein
VHDSLRRTAANPHLPSELVDRLISVADDDIAMDLADRPDLSRAQAVALARRVESSAVHLAYRGRLAAADIDPAVWPDAALALLDQGIGRPEWARLLAADPVRERREKPAACPGLSAADHRGTARRPGPAGGTGSRSQPLAAAGRDGGPGAPVLTARPACPLPTRRATSRLR